MRVILVGRRDDDHKQPRFQQAWFLGLIGGSSEAIALHPDGVQRHHGEWRVSPLDDPVPNSLMTECDRKTPGCKTCQDVRYHRGWRSAECRERILPATVPDTMWTVAPTVQEPSSGSGVKRSNIEAIRRADAEAEKALTRARLLQERRAAKRTSATGDELDTIMVAAEDVLTETRETVEALTVSALQQAHAMSHRAETTAEIFFQAHKDMTMTTFEQARKKQLDLFESMEVYEEVYVDDLPAGTHIMSGRWVNTNSLEVQVHSERLRRTSQ